jgi:ketosteroid isomerase-like protein
VTEGEAAVRDLITGWARAVREADLDHVLAEHDSEIVMFDVPPPFDGVRGIAAHRDSWPPFFEWQRQGACFEVCAAAHPKTSRPTPTTSCG